MSFDRLLLAVESRDLSQADYLALGNLILSFKNLPDCKVNIFLSFYGER